TFEIAVEMLERHRWVVHESVSDTVDTLLRNRKPSPQVRTVNETGHVTITRELPEVAPTKASSLQTPASAPNVRGWRSSGQMQPMPVSKAEIKSRPLADEFGEENSFEQLLDSSWHQEDIYAREHEISGPNGEDLPLQVYPYGISRQQLDQVIEVLNLPVVLTKEMDNADAVLALRSHVKNHSKLRHISKARHIPIHSIKASTIPQITRSLRRMLNMDESILEETTDLRLFSHNGSEDEIEALEEARLAVEQIVIPKGQPVELLPRSPKVRKIQHELVEHYHLKSTSFGDEPNRRLRIFPA
ncbi:MAG TPA: R3H domain-containing nucleic acid-binding protein, partial [Candidatus Sericytochromatia bacterium]